MYNVFSDLVSLGLASNETSDIFAEKTRDCSSLTVWRDKISGVIFIKEFYVGDTAYNAAGNELHSSSVVKRTSFEDAKDCARRVKRFKSLYHSKDICELGFGSGEFMDAIVSDSKSVSGVELNTEQLSALSGKGYSVARNLSKFQERYFDTVFLFHAFEHFPDPLDKLRQIKKSLKSGGRIVIEVPNAGDFLLRDDVECVAFKAHSLWSQHLILHTRNSLNAMLNACGFNDIVIEGVQRYPLSNHLHWLVKGKPGGHASNMSALDSELLSQAYSSSLSRIDATDTLIAVASAP